MANRLTPSALIWLPAAVTKRHRSAKHTTHVLGGQQNKQQDTVACNHQGSTAQGSIASAKRMFTYGLVGAGVVGGGVAERGAWANAPTGSVGGPIGDEHCHA